MHDMTDVFSKEKRSLIMSRIKGRNTKPEVLVRSYIHKMGFRFRLDGRGLPGKPDIVLPRHKKVVFVHGCFWHGHKGCKRSKRPSTNEEFWNRKLDLNMERDKRFQGELRLLGWRYLVIWECGLKKPEKVAAKLERFLNEDKKY
jgi:DNA mismatch endonuclease, patch repair protein